MSFSNFSNKIKICLNYIVFQQMITGSIPVLLLSAFIHTESYIFYFLYAMSLIIFVFYIIGKFTFLFFQGRLKQVLSGLTVVITIIVVGLMASYFDVHIPKQLSVAFEDPIASEFYVTECFNETKKALSVVNSSQEKSQEIIKLTKSISSYLESEPSIPSEADFFLASKRAEQLLYMWKLEKEKEYYNIDKNINILESKLTKARFKNNRDILLKDIETYNRYKSFLDEYDKTLTVLASLDYKDVSAVKRKSFKDSTGDIAVAMQLVKDTVMTKYQIDIMKLNLAMHNVFTDMVNDHVEVVNKTFAYIDFTHKIRKYFPLYHHRMIPET